MLVRRAEMLPVECIVRGYLFGSAWKEYQATGTVHGAARCRPGCAGRAAARARCSRPTTKAASGDARREHHVRRRRRARRRRRRRARRGDLASRSYAAGAAHAEARGIILADTKLELGIVDGELVAGRRDAHARLVALLAGRRVEARASRRRRSTSSRARLARGHGWDKRPPPPPLPAEVVARHPGALRRGLRAHHRRDFDDWPGRA